MRVQIFSVGAFCALERTSTDDYTRSFLPHACVWPSNSGEFEDVQRRMLKRKCNDVSDSVEEVALRDPDVTGEALCDDNPNAAK
jgi:hypothetical protein